MSNKYSIIHDNVLLDPKKVEKLFSEVSNPRDYLAGLLTMVFPDLEKIARIEDYPHVNTKTTQWLFRLCVEADKRIQNEVLKLPWLSSERWMEGGYWLNNGFSTDNTLDDYVVSPCAVTYKHSEAVA